MACPHLTTMVLQRVQEELELIMSTQVHKEMDGASHSQMLEMLGALNRYRSLNRLDHLFSSNLHSPLLTSMALLEHRDMLTK